MYPFPFYPVQAAPAWCPLAYPYEYSDVDELNEDVEDRVFRNAGEDYIDNSNETVEAGQEDFAGRQMPPAGQGQYGPGMTGHPGYQGYPGYPGYPGQPGNYPPRPAEIARLIELRDPTILRTIVSAGIPVQTARTLVRRIVRETLTFCR